MVQSGATLKMPDLQRNGAASVEAIYDLVYSGKGKMPGYGAGCTPKVRLHSASIMLLQLNLWDMGRLIPSQISHAD